MKEWSEMIPAHTMGALLDRCFFPKWLQTLSVWLNMNPDLEQVRTWFRGWETLIQENIREQPIVRGRFSSNFYDSSHAVEVNSLLYCCR